MQHRQRTGLTRLTRYLEGKRLRVAVLLLAAVGEAAAQTGGWLLVRAAIDNGISKGDERYLTAVVILYVAVGVVLLTLTAYSRLWVGTGGKIAFLLVLGAAGYAAFAVIRSARRY